MRQKVGEAKDAPASGNPATAPEASSRSVEDLRYILKKFRRAMGGAGNPGCIGAEAALRAGWVISSGTVEGQGDEIFHVFMLTNGALFYFSGEIVEPIEFTGKWILGDSIPELEAKIPHTVAGILAQHGLDWPDSPQL